MTDDILVPSGSERSAASPRYLIISIDTEVDKDSRWRISRPASFRSVLEGVPDVLSPLFERYGAVPTYFLSPEVIENADCSEVMVAVGAQAELATHLHSDFVAPARTIETAVMGGQRADSVQCVLPRQVERAKLENLTAMFEDVFRERPKAFRAGRFGISRHTLSLLAELGYAVDSSVTPGILWRFGQATVDYRAWSAAPVRLHTPNGSIVEMPVSISPGGRAARALAGAPEIARRVGGKLLGQRARMHWLRPSWENRTSLVRYLDRAKEHILVAMFHSTEVIAGASPFASTAAESSRIIGALDALLEEAARREMRLGVRMSEVASYL
jgi:hypothetical protein